MAMPGCCYSPVAYEMETHTIIACSRCRHRLLPTKETLDKVCHCVDITMNRLGVRGG
jgi:hypothetical protein